MVPCVWLIQAAACCLVINKRDANQVHVPMPCRWDRIHNAIEDETGDIIALTRCA